MAKSSYISLIAFFVLAQLAAVTEAQEIIDVFRWVVPYDGPKEFTANVGDTMVFRWAQGQHNVYIHPTMDCTLDGAIFVGFAPGTEYTFVEADGSPEGTDMFFSCDIGNGAHCRAGQSLTVTVFSAAEEVPEIVNSDPVEEEPAVETPVPEEPVIVNEAPEEEAEQSEAPVAAAVPDAPEPEPEPAAAEPATESEAAEPATESESAEPATESESAESSSGNGVNSFATVAALLFACLALTF